MLHPLDFSGKTVNLFDRKYVFIYFIIYTTLFIVIYLGTSISFHTQLKMSEKKIHCNLFKLQIKNCMYCSFLKRNFLYYLSFIGSLIYVSSILLIYIMTSIGSLKEREEYKDSSYLFNSINQKSIFPVQFLCSLPLKTC